MQRTDYFISAFVPQYHSFEKDVFKRANETFILDGFQRQKFSNLLENIADSINTPLEVIHHPLDNQTIGLFSPYSKRLILLKDVFFNHVLSPLPLYAKKEFNDMHIALKEAQECFKSAHDIHDQKEKIYIKEMDFEFLDILSHAVAERILRNTTLKNFAEENYVERYFGAPLIQGNFDYIDALTENISVRYLIKGRPGSGKSTFLKKIADTLSERGYLIERYHCSMDINSLDMIICRELDVALFDCTAPHEHKKIEGKDEVIDLFKECLPQDIDMRHREEIEKLNHAYKEKINAGQAALNDLYLKEEIYVNKLKQPTTDEYRKIKDNLYRFISN